MNMFASTSPSFLILQSVERMADLLCERGADEHKRLLGDIDLFRQRAAELGFEFKTGRFYDPYRIVLNCGNSGEKLYYFLAGRNIFCEFFNKDSVIIIPSINNPPGDFDKLLAALRGFAEDNEIIPAEPGGYIYPPGIPAVLNLYF
jgi:arginine/lysine/ornithine decarboxylase